MADRVRWLFHSMLVRPLLFALLGLRANDGKRLPRCGPGIIVANHNSHLDALAILALYPPRLAARLRPVAASDYFLGNSLCGWLARRLLDIIPLSRDCRPRHGDPLAACSAALQCGAILIFFPEGTRGEPGSLGEFKPGIAHLARRHPGIPIVPVFLTSLDRVLPKGALLPLPLLCEARIGTARYWRGDCRSFLAELRAAIVALGANGTDADATARAIDERAAWQPRSGSFSAGSPLRRPRATRSPAPRSRGSPRYCHGRCPGQIPDRGGRALGKVRGSSAFFALLPASILGSPDGHRTGSIADEAGARIDLDRR